MAQHADEKQWKAFIDALDPDKIKKPNEAPADALIRQMKELGLWHSLKT